MIQAALKGLHSAKVGMGEFTGFDEEFSGGPPFGRFWEGPRIGGFRDVDVYCVVACSSQQSYVYYIVVRFRSLAFAACPLLASNFDADYVFLFAWQNPN